MPVAPSASTPSRKTVFAFAALAAGLFALSTGRVWEDYYITYRISRNLALGHGMVYTVGERVHAFTSPLGMLLPALANALVFHSSDLAALWIFRAISVAAFAGAATFVFVTTRSLGWGRLSGALPVLWLITDNKSLDFSINGMETGLLLFFLSGTLWALFAAPPSRRWRHLGLGWAGLMWTRPDGFIYIAALTLGTFLFGDAERGGLTRRQWLKVTGGAALLCAAIYLPWFVGTWHYYGTPIPHTVIAKSSVAPPRTLWGAFQALLCFPVSSIFGNAASDGLLMPSYARFGDWPDALALLARGVAGVSAFIWLIPQVKREARIASLACFLVLVYLSYYPLHVAPWYLPGPALLAFFALGGAMESFCRVCAARRTWLAAVPAGAALVWLGCGIWLTVEGARLSAVEQNATDDGCRRSVGRWLAMHAAPRDRVFMECLGYIGYYSGLKTYDYPGMSSPEVVAASRESHGDWNEIIARLRPEWLVLRPMEIMRMTKDNGTVLGADYEMTRVFDVTDELKTFGGYGRGLLAYDAVFILFHRTDTAYPPAPDAADGPGASGIPPQFRDATEEAVLRLRRALEVWPQNRSLLKALGGRAPTPLKAD